MSKMSPTARSLAECKRRGWLAQNVERFNTFTKRRHDLFGCIDIVAVDGTSIIGIQATSGQTGGNHSARVAKILAEPRIAKWIESGGRMAVWSWAKRGTRGKQKRWALREEWIMGRDVIPATAKSVYEIFKAAYNDDGAES